MFIEMNLPYQTVTGYNNCGNEAYFPDFQLINCAPLLYARP
jgi:hypothetical protein